MNNDVLPAGWLRATLGEVTAPKVEQSGPDARNGAFVYVDIGSIGPTKAISTRQTVLTAEAPSRARQRLRAGDVVVSMTRPNLNAVALVPPEFEGAVASTGFHVLRAQMVEPRYLYSVVRSPAFVAAMTEMVQGALYPAVRPDDVRAFEFALPPLAEQKRIVAKLEELSARIGRAREALDTVPLLLDKLRQSIVAAAFRGDLTADWRAKNPNVEPADQLLARIRAERRGRWESVELAKLNAKGKCPNNDRWKAGYTVAEPLSRDELSGLPALPQSWTWEPLESLCVDIADIDHKMPKAVSEGVKFISAKDLLDDGTLNLTDDVKRISELDFQRLARKIAPTRGDIIYSRIGARLGKARLVETDERFLASYSCCTIRPVMSSSAVYLTLYLDSEFVLRRALQDTQSVGVPDLGLAKIRRFPVPVCPEEESAVLVPMLLRAIAYRQAIMAQYVRITGDMRKLEGSVLAKALRGELVEQDRNDEPASALLERIRVARADVVSSGPTAPRRTRRVRLKRATA